MCKTSLLHTSSSVCIYLSVSKQGLLNFPSCGRSCTFLNGSQEKTWRFGRKTVGSPVQHQAETWSRGSLQRQKSTTPPFVQLCIEYKWRPQIAIRPYCVNLGFPCHTAFLAPSALLFFSWKTNQHSFYIWVLILGTQSGFLATSPHGRSLLGNA